MTPYQHGEVYVTDDGAETDLDLGHYERFTHAPLTKHSNYTTGKIYSVGHREGAARRLPRQDGAGDPAHHRRDQGGASAAAPGDADVLISEIGGTVGDIEGLPVPRGDPPVRARGGPRGHALFVHLTLAAVPARERRAEDEADAAVGREAARDRHPARRAHLPHRAADARDEMTAEDLALLQRARSKARDRGARRRVLDLRGAADAGRAGPRPAPARAPRPAARHAEARRLPRAARRASATRAARSRSRSSASTSSCTTPTSRSTRRSPTPASPTQVQGARAARPGRGRARRERRRSCCRASTASSCPAASASAASRARSRRSAARASTACRSSASASACSAPTIEFARHVAGLEGAHSTEFDPDTPHPVIDLMADQQGAREGRHDAPRRLPLRAARRARCARAAYGDETINERHRHRYEFNNDYRERARGGRPA